jgi:hypothetical protein
MAWEMGGHGNQVINGRKHAMKLGREDRRNPDSKTRGRGTRDGRLRLQLATQIMCILSSSIVMDGLEFGQVKLIKCLEEDGMSMLTTASRRLRKRTSMRLVAMKMLQIAASGFLEIERRHIRERE